jgi:hypothetical protein
VKFTSGALLVVENPITARAGRLDIWTHTHSPGPIAYTAIIHVFFLVLEYICLTCSTWDSLAFLSSFFAFLFVTGLSEVGLAWKYVSMGGCRCVLRHMLFLQTPSKSIVLVKKLFML